MIIWKGNHSNKTGKETFPSRIWKRTGKCQQLICTDSYYRPSTCHYSVLLSPFFHVYMYMPEACNVLTRDLSYQYSSFQRRVGGGQKERNSQQSSCTSLVYAINYCRASSIINLARMYHFVTNKMQTLLNELFTIKGYILKCTIIIAFCKHSSRRQSRGFWLYNDVG